MVPQRVKPGNVRITGRLGELESTVTLTVLGPPASIAITSTQDTLIVGQGLGVSVVAKDAFGAVLGDRRFSFTSSDPSVATADEQGGVVGVAPVR